MNPQDMQDTTKHFSYIIAFNCHTSHHEVGGHNLYVPHLQRSKLSNFPTLGI